MIYDVKPGAKLQRNPQISKSFMLKYPRISKSFMLKYPQISKSLAFRTKNKYFPHGVGGSCGTGGTGGNSLYQIIIRNAIRQQLVLPNNLTFAFG